MFRKLNCEILTAYGGAAALEKLAAAAELKDGRLVGRYPRHRAQRLGGAEHPQLLRAWLSGGHRRSG